MPLDLTATERALIRAATKIQADDESKFNRGTSRLPRKQANRAGASDGPLPVTPGQWTRATGGQPTAHPYLPVEQPTEAAQDDQQ